MKDFEYAAPATVESATALLEKYGDAAKILAGGTDIIVQLREGLREADVVVDIKNIPEIVDYQYSADVGLQLGAATPCYRIYGDEELAKAYPAVLDSTRIIGGWQIQSRASVGGNLCNASPAADSIPSLIAHQAMCHIAGPHGRRSVAAQDFCTGPGRNALEQGEILVALTLPPSKPKSGSAYLRFIPRNEMDIAVVGAASWVQLDDSGESIQSARVALAAVAPMPLYAEDASSWLSGQPANADTFAEAGELAKNIVSPISDMRGTAEYRQHLVGVLVKRTLKIAVERARTNQ